jgi:uncharacterized protein YdhG (YjbR/CyaY superfamily)
MAQPRAVKAIYDSAPVQHRQTMLLLRERILEIVPNAEEVISYGMPAFKVKENIVAGIMAAKNHVGYYPFSGSVLHLFPKELAKYRSTKSAIHVPIGEALPKVLISKLIKARISQCRVKQGRVNLGKYAKLDSHWRELGIAAPARRGLVDKKLFKIGDLRTVMESEFLEIHGMGPKAAAVIRREMKRRKIIFRPERTGKKKVSDLA